MRLWDNETIHPVWAGQPRLTTNCDLRTTLNSFSVNSLYNRSSSCTAVQFVKVRYGNISIVYLALCVVVN